MDNSEIEVWVSTWVDDFCLTPSAPNIYLRVCCYEVKFSVMPTELCSCCMLKKLAFCL